MEDLFDDYGVVEQDWYQDVDQGDYWNYGVFDCVYQYYVVFVQVFGLGGVDVILVQYFQYYGVGYVYDYC